MHVTAVTEGEIEQDIVQFNAHVTPAKTSLNLPAGLVSVEATRGLTTAINPLDKDAEKQNLSGVAPRYVSNTLEQYLLSSGDSLILSSHLSSENMHVIPVRWFSSRLDASRSPLATNTIMLIGHLDIWSQPSRLFILCVLCIQLRQQ